MSYERSSIQELASELGILPDRIYSWRKDFPGHGIERLSDEGRRVKELEIFEYIEIFYNKIKRHSALKNRTIDEFNKLNSCLTISADKVWKSKKNETMINVTK